MDQIKEKIEIKLHSNNVDAQYKTANFHLKQIEKGLFFVHGQDVDTFFNRFLKPANGTIYNSFVFIGKITYNGNRTPAFNVSGLCVYNSDAQDLINVEGVFNSYMLKRCFSENGVQMGTVPAWIGYSGDVGMDAAPFDASIIFDGVFYEITT